MIDIFRSKEDGPKEILFYSQASPSRIIAARRKLNPGQTGDQGKTFVIKQQTNQSITEIQIFGTANRNDIKHLIQLTSITANHPAPPSLQRKSPNPSTTYAEVTKKHQASKKPTTLLLYPMKSAEKEEVLEILKREIARPSTKIKYVQKIKNKGVAVRLERDQEVEELIQTINSKETLKSTIETKKPGKRHPSIIIYNLPDETIEDEVQEALAINADIKERLNIRFKLSGRQPGTAHWILETPSESFYKLKRLGKLPIHWTMHQVREFFHIKRCNKCQGFRHLAKDCPSNRPSCGSCAGHHPTTKCRSSQVVCINCAMHNQFHGTRFPAYHHTSDSGCSCYLGEVALYKETRDY
ncbi:hypothetical protein AVEN_137221-1 [Araneus ventricosus]|uniref:CCHC-type domain-containing protein n=1 Tax=Araneus ventricosus TaxID=182803 RepID=A0A4Y2ISM1_ARAVE|nr:hypothetical protein AVEN_137221-1 [Araneus ventricosus]